MRFVGTFLVSVKDRKRFRRLGALFGLNQTLDELDVKQISDFSMGTCEIEFLESTAYISRPFCLLSHCKSLFTDRLSTI